MAKNPMRYPPPSVITADTIAPEKGNASHLSYTFQGYPTTGLYYDPANRRIVSYVDNSESHYFGKTSITCQNYYVANGFYKSLNQDTFTIRGGVLANSTIPAVTFSNSSTMTNPDGKLVAWYRDSSSALESAALSTFGSLKLGGGLATRVVTKTANYTATTDDSIILCNATGGAITITLPPASSKAGMQLIIKKIDSSAYTVTIDGDSSETIDGATTVSLSTQYSSKTIVSDGTNWYIIASV